MHPLDDTVRLLVQHHQIRTIPPMPAEVLSQTGQTLELRLLVPDDVREVWGLDAGMQGVPMTRQGCWQVSVAPGTRVLVEFAANDPRQALVRTILEGSLLSVDLDALSIKIGPQAVSVELGPGALKTPVASTGSPVQVAPATGIGTVTNAPAPVQAVVKV